MQIVFFGAGTIAQVHVDAFSTIDGVSLAGVCSRRRSSAETLVTHASKAGLCNQSHMPPRVTTDLDDLLMSSRPDCLIIATPNDVRLSPIERACDMVRAGKSTLRAIACEKPLGRSGDEAAAIRSAISGSGQHEVYLENQVFMPAVTFLRHWLDTRVRSGDRLHSVRLSLSHGGPGLQWFFGSERTGGGVLRDLGCHA
ncbi:MAG: Gfo/Idh/MocA family oxidoreductase, partial [Pseudomonadota bacterium]